MSISNDIAERFASDVANHEMTVLRDEGLYRHVRFQRVTVNEETGKRERSSSYWFDLITWPGCLAITGDMDSYLFARTDDMFGFFRLHGGGINPGYWAEKIRAGSVVREYSEDQFKRLVAEDAEEYEKDHPGLAAAIKVDILDDPDTAFEDGARRLLDNFSYGDTWGGKCPSCDSAVSGLAESDARSWALGHRAQAGHSVFPARTYGFRFEASYEWELTEFSWRYLWACHAIQWGIAQYNAQRAAEPATADANEAVSAR